MPGKIAWTDVEDGRDGFEKLVEFSDYIAIGYPELRRAYPSDYAKIGHGLIRYARRMRPNIKIHMLGCTELSIVSKNKDCTTCDSTSWQQPLRFGSIRVPGVTKSKHVSEISGEALERRMGECLRTASQIGISLGSEKRLRDCAAASLFAEIELSRYRHVIGDQS